jgi:uncharacterized membrane protein YbhN (UPF0104 family)
MMKKKSYGLVVIKLTVGIFIFSYLYSYINREISVLNAFLKANLEWISYGILLMIPTILLQSFRWHLLVQTISEKTNFWESIASTLGGMSLGILTPGRIGEIGKGLFLDHIEKWQITGMALLDRIFNMIAIMLLGSFSFLYLFNYVYNLPIILILPVIIFLTISFIFIFFILIRIDLLKSVYYRFKILHKVKDQLKQLMSAITFINKKIVIKVFLVSVLIQVFIGFQFIVFIKAFNVDIALIDGLVSSFSIAFTKATLPISIADIGIRESAAIFYFGLFIKSKAAIFSGTFLLFSVNVIFPSILGIFMIPKLNFQKDL